MGFEESSRSMLSGKACRPRFLRLYTHLLIMRATRIIEP